MKVTQQQIDSLNLVAQLLQIGSFTISGQDVPKVMQAMQELQKLIGEMQKQLTEQEK